MKQTKGGDKQDNVALNEERLRLALALGMQLDGKLIEGFEYNLANTPCSDATQHGFCSYEEAVCEAFPDDESLIEMKAEGYFGVGLKNEAGESNGVLCVISRKKLSLQPKTKQVFEIIAARAAVEVERMQTERKLKERFDEIEHMNSLMVGRELKMEELRQEINRLKEEKQ